jgi:nucleotide-binding universal stress UspA family protein
MKPIAKILVPIDFAACSGLVVEMAIELAKRFDAALDFFHVWQPPAMLPMPLIVVPEPGGPQIAADEVARAIAGAQLKELTAQAQKAGIRELHAHVGIGNPAHEIVELAGKAKFDLIVMGTHGRGGLTHALLGSVAEKVVRQAPCPVVTVRARE